MTDFRTHFEDDAWLGFVRGLVIAEEKQAMRAHLNQGCEECRQTYEAWQRFVEIAKQEAWDVAPESAIRFVKAAFALRRRVAFRQGLAHVAERIFDSFQEPLPMGLRGSPASPRQLLYQAGNLLIDLRLEQNPGASGALTGQVVSAQSGQSTGCAGVVLLREPNTVIAQTITNSLGEFQLDFERQDDLRVCLELLDGTLLDVVLPGNVMTRGRGGPPGNVSKG